MTQPEKEYCDCPKKAGGILEVEDLKTMIHATCGKKIIFDFQPEEVAAKFNGSSRDALEKELESVKKARDMAIQEIGKWSREAGKLEADYASLKVVAERMKEFIETQRCGMGSADPEYCERCDVLAAYRALQTPPDSGGDKKKGSV